MVEVRAAENPMAGDMMAEGRGDGVQGDGARGDGARGDGEGQAGPEMQIEFALWSDILGLIARLHDREADAGLLQGLRSLNLGEVFDDLLEVEEDRAIAEAFAVMLDELPDPPTPAYLDELAADFADAYLIHGFRAAPTGSVWLTDDHLERQEPMFVVREWYHHYGIVVPNWRLRADDHLVHEIEFVQHLLQLGTVAALQDASIFLDRHLLSWAPDFCLRVAQHTREPFYALANLLTRAVLADLRARLEAATGIVREPVSHAWAREAERAGRAAEAETGAETGTQTGTQTGSEDADSPFVPGLAESW